MSILPLVVRLAVISSAVTGCNRVQQLLDRNSTVGTELKLCGDLGWLSMTKSVSRILESGGPAESALEAILCKGYRQTPFLWMLK